MTAPLDPSAATESLADANDDAAADRQPAGPGQRTNLFLFGLVMAAFAAVCYSGTNVALRKLADNKSFDWAIFVTACKAIGAATAAWALIVRGWVRGVNLFPPRRFWPRLLLAAVCTSIVGNLTFQYALSIGGLALVMPVVFAMIILTGAGLGWLVLKEPVGPLLAFAMAVLIAAIVVLSLGAQTAADSAAAGLREPAAAAFVILCAVVAGFGYGCVGVVVRSVRLGGVGVAGTLVMISSFGFVSLGALSLARLGWSEIAATTASDAFWITTASVLNAVAFFSIAVAYEHLAVVRVNLINSSQSAMCALAGVVVFAEPATVWLVVGTLLTLLGLGVVAYARENA